jgi:hypothetical protein
MRIGGTQGASWRKLIRRLIDLHPSIEAFCDGQIKSLWNASTEALRALTDTLCPHVTCFALQCGAERGYGRSSLESKMMTSRRPKRHASSESAPGPSSASAIQMITRFRWAMELARVGAWLDGNCTKPIITFPAAANPQNIGVRTPTRIEPPVTIVRPPRHQQEAFR